MYTLRLRKTGEVMKDNKNTIDSLFCFGSKGSYNWIKLLVIEEL